MKVKDFMTAKVIYLSTEDTLLTTTETLDKYRISGAPVLQGNKLVGVISSSDIVRFISENVGKPELAMHPSVLALVKQILGDRELAKKLAKVLETKVGSVMTKNPITVSGDANETEVATLMDKHEINRLPVVDRFGKLVGIVARQDLIRTLRKEIAEMRS